MTLPASGTISLNDIRVELQQASTNVSLGAMSNLVGFVDPDAVSEFYGYSYAAYNTFGILDTSYGEYVDACARDVSDNKTLYFAGSGGTPACPAQGVTLYTNSALTTAYNGGGFWWRSKQCNAAYNILSDGFIEAIQAC
jgi:hypothetical protein